MVGRSIGQIAADAFLAKLEEYLGIPTYQNWDILPEGERQSWETAAQAIIWEWERRRAETMIDEVVESRSSLMFLATAE